MTARDFDARAEAGFQQIEAWKTEKNWEGVYDKGPVLKKEIAADLAKAETLVKDDAALLFEINFLKWRNLFDDDPETAFGMFDAVVDAAKGAVASREGLGFVKAAADSVRDLEDKNISRRLYEVYAGSVMGAGLTPGELFENAEGFLAEENNYLAKTLYEAWLAAFSDDKEVQAKNMILVADKFAHSGKKDALDPVYAEEMYRKAGDLAGDVAFEGASQYRRAFNLERIKDYDAAFAQYKKLLTLFPGTALEPEVLFRLGIFEVCARKDRAAAATYFSKIITEFSKDPVALPALYQSGVLAQWNEETQAAKTAYEALLAAAQELGLDLQKTELAVLARERLGEITDGLQMKYGLRLFLEGIFSKASEASVPLHVDLTVSPAKSATGASVKFVASTSNPQTGCMTPTYAYEWSGQLGGIDNIPNSPELTTTYPEKGLCVVGVAVVGPNGPQGVGFDIVQLQGSGDRVQGSEKTEPGTRYPAP
jgi:tetratricopeptide (TPR) repeat protein